jgi:hypothetical protein
MEENKRKAPRIPYWGDDVPDPKPLPVSGKDILNGILPGCSMSLVWLCMSYLNIYDDLEGCAELLFSTATLERWLQAVGAKEEKSHEDEKIEVYSRLIAQGQVCCWFDRPHKDHVYPKSTQMYWSFNGVPFRLFGKPPRIGHWRDLDGRSKIAHSWPTEDGTLHSDEDKPSFIELYQTPKFVQIRLVWYRHNSQRRMSDSLPSAFVYKRRTPALVDDDGIVQWEGGRSIDSTLHAALFELWVRPHLPDGWINFMPEFHKPVAKAEIEQCASYLLSRYYAYSITTKDLDALVSKLYP